MQAIPLGLSIGILAGIWTYAAPLAGLLVWPCFVGWALFFAAGGDRTAIWKAMAPIISGVVLAWLAVLISPYLGSAAGLAIAVTIVAFIMVIMLNIPWFTFVPAQFAAAAAYFGANLDFPGALIPMLIGVLLGYVSGVIPGFFTAGAKEKEAA